MDNVPLKYEEAPTYTILGQMDRWRNGRNGDDNNPPAIGQGVKILVSTRKKGEGATSVQKTVPQGRKGKYSIKILPKYLLADSDSIHLRSLLV